LAFLKSQNALLVGAQGASIIWEQKKDQLLKGYWYCSFDEKEHLPFLDGYRRVPDVCANSGGGFNFGLGSFELVWDEGDAVLVLCDY
jgi:hypothetical protein